MTKIREKAEEIVRSFAVENEDGAEKHERVVSNLSMWIDDQLKWGDGPVGRLAEQIDGVVIRLLVGVIVKEVYDRTLGAGK